uniref:(northern house mosquito) hypothetical protein n=1 Tax=Culex pipiens TaxID=7175 RepID=A0A8D8B314_CULPI
MCRHLGAQGKAREARLAEGLLDRIWGQVWRAERSGGQIRGRMGSRREGGQARVAEGLFGRVRGEVWSAERSRGQVCGWVGSSGGAPEAREPAGSQSWLRWKANLNQQHQLNCLKVT